jgi:hypothetical protein
MDALSAGAGAVAFITLALQSTKVLYEIISAIRDCPKHVQDLGHDVEQLRSILGRLAQYQALLQDDQSLAVLTQRCSDDISLYVCRLQKMRISPTEQRTGKIWKKLKAAISEKDLDAMRFSIHRYVSSLSLQISIVQV